MPKSEEEENKCSTCNGLKFVEDREGAYMPCPVCYKREMSIESLKRNKLYDRVLKNTFSTYRVISDETEYALAIAMNYVNCFKDCQDSIMIMGQVGSGKTHLALAIVGELIGKANVNIFNYTEEIAKLKIDRRSFDETNRQHYYDRVTNFKNCQLLLIEDLFWGNVDKEELEIIYEIINHRYNSSKNKSVIITTELDLPKLLQVDEALGSRLVEMCKEYIIEFNEGYDNNFRLR